MSFIYNTSRLHVPLDSAIFLFPWKKEMTMYLTHWYVSVYFPCLNVKLLIIKSIAEIIIYNNETMNPHLILNIFCII